MHRCGGPACSLPRNRRSEPESSANSLRRPLTRLAARHGRKYTTKNIASSCWPTLFCSASHSNHSRCMPGAVLHVLALLDPLLPYTCGSVLSTADFRYERCTFEGILLRFLVSLVHPTCFITMTKHNTQLSIREALEKLPGSLYCYILLSTAQIELQGTTASFTNSNPLGCPMHSLTLLDFQTIQRIP